MSSNQNYHYLFKYIVIGDSSVGKSCLINQFTNGKFNDEMECTLGIEFGCKTIQVLGKSIKLQIWDTAGQESYKSITRSYYRGSIGGIIVYDITREETFKNSIRWLEDIKQHSADLIELIIVGNKLDKESERIITTKEGQEFAVREKLEFIETSAKISKNVDKLFYDMTTKILGKIGKNQIDLSNEIYGIKLGPLCKEFQQKNDKHALENSKKSKDNNCC